MKLWRNWIDWFRDTPQLSNRDDAQSETLPDGSSPLRLRLLFIVTIALTPIAVVSILQGMDRAQRDAADVHERLIETARAAASREGNMIAAAEQVVRAVSSLPDVRDATEDCTRALESAVHGTRYVINLSRVSKSGRVLCSALPQAVGVDVSKNALFVAAREASNDDDFVIQGPRRSTIIPRSIVGGMLPLRDSAGQFNGSVGIALDLAWLKDLLRLKQLPEGAIAGVFDKTGHLIAANDPDTAKILFAHADPSEPNELQTAVDQQNRKWVYAATPLLHEEVFVGFAMREATLFAPTYVHVTTDFLMPVLMIGLAWIAIWFGTDRLVTRWIMYLKRISGAYRAGHYTIRPSLDAAPAEFQLLGGALSDMAGAIQDRDRKLRESVAQKTELIREIHHRVKNNLQIVMSLLSLQTAQMQDPSAKAALAQAQMRINALALVHRMLHEIEDQTTIELKRLLTDLSRQIADGMGGGHENVSISLDLIPCSVPAEVAIPLALFSVEAITNAYKYAFPDPDKVGSVSIVLKRDGKTLMLTIADDGIGYDVAGVKRSIGSRLITTFGQQVGGVSAVRSIVGEGTTVEIQFPEPDLTPPDIFKLG
jgi:two-component sensor histidine kinase